MAEHLEVTEEFFKETIERYLQKYGTYTTVKNYIIYFEPTLGVMKLTNEEIQKHIYKRNEVYS